MNDKFKERAEAIVNDLFKKEQELKLNKTKHDLFLDSLNDHRTLAEKVKDNLFNLDKK